MTSTIARVKPARYRRDLPPYRVGHWIVAGTPAAQPYPCVCLYSPCTYKRCDCRGRTEGDALPPGCCGKASPVAGERLESPGGHRDGGAGPSSTWRPSGTPERSSRGLPQPPAPLGPAVAGDLWSAPWDREPPAWDALDDPEPPEDSPDEAFPLAGETLEPAPGHANRDAGPRQHSEGSDGLQQARNRIWADQCDCPTPWDPPPAVLLVADTKTGPVRRSIALDGPRPESRERAEQALADLGWRLVKPWRDGRHTLLPPDGKLKTRPGLVADLAGPDNSRAYAVVDLPPEESPGVHCIDCHISFSSNVAYQLHRPSWMRPCREPSKVITALHGTPMLIRGAGAVWALNTEAVYGPGGCPMPRGAAMDLHQRASRELKRWQYGKGHNRR